MPIAVLGPPRFGIIERSIWSFGVVGSLRGCCSPYQVLDDSLAGQDARPGRNTRAKQQCVDARLGVDTRGQHDGGIERVAWHKVTHGGNLTADTDAAVTLAPPQRGRRPARYRNPIPRCVDDAVATVASE
jgi:hypothetical protein